MPVFDGQHDVENYQVVFIDGGLIERLLAVAGDIDSVRIFAEAFGHKGSHARFVFHQEDAHFFIVRGSGGISQMVAGCESKTGNKQLAADKRR